MKIESVSGRATHPGSLMRMGYAHAPRLGLPHQGCCQARPVTGCPGAELPGKSRCIRPNPTPITPPPQGRASSSSGWLDRRPAVCVHPGLGSPSSEAALETCRELAPRDTHVWGLTETRRLGSGRAHARGCPVMWARTQDLLRAVPRGTFIPSMQFGYGTAQGVTPGLAAGGEHPKRRAVWWC